MNLVAIVGPTAAGKSRVAERLATEAGAGIVSVDSMQVYRGMDIGTAKPPATVRAAIPHRMIDLVEPDVDYTVKEFQDAGRAAIRDLASGLGRVIICGGSGMHFRALVDPMTFAPTSPDVRAALDSQSSDSLRKRLLSVDADAGDHVDLANPRRLVRAIEVYELTGMTPTRRSSSPEARAVAAYEPQLPFVGFGIDPGDDVKVRAERRFDEMLANGLLDEVRRLEGHLGATAAQAVGYKELLPVVTEEVDLASGREDAIVATRALIKRQRTYFRRDPRIVWLPWQDGGEEATVRTVEEIKERAGWTS